ncbi:ABC transporter ATP-binding protein [Clostridium sp. YIM B02505]|uniref:ABC transporter ATP-binding protein n=1 Tax=Clostridium yunnanense TaxID=2800325 RepID=A0ABS1ERI5_9CLOT|nr:ABC transporter ATP-binding protein [Clostridium yunnanense]MBK1812002.1 ABC transporter ATP-binding protein [Clostridium yunnanense]
MSIELKGISHSYDAKNYILKDFNLTIDKGEIVAIIGSSGSGKSTLLNIVGGINVPSSGEILLDGVNINNLKAKDVESFKLSKIGYIFQNYNLIPFLNVMDNILLPVNLLKKKLDSYKEEAINLLKELNLESKANANILELSGGEQQRVAIARALILNPSIILADEPTGSLDRDNTTNFMKLLKEISIKRSISVMLVTHDLKVTEYATRVIDISK